MGYALLSKLYYKNREQYEETYQARFRSEYAIHVDFAIDGAPAFFLQTPAFTSVQMLLVHSVKILWIRNL